MRRATYWSALVLCLPWATALTAQEQPKRQETAVGSRLSDFGGFVELDFRFGTVMGDYGAFAGARAGVVLKRRMYLGLAGAGLATDNATVSGPTPGDVSRLHLGYGGLLVGYMVPTRSMVQFSADLLIAGGGVSAGGEDSRDAVLVYEPSVAVDLRLVRFARLRFGAGYRFVWDAELAGVTDQDLRGATGTMGIRLEWF